MFTRMVKQRCVWSRQGTYGSLANPPSLHTIKKYWSGAGNIGLLAPLLTIKNSKLIIFSRKGRAGKPGFPATM